MTGNLGKTGLQLITADVSSTIGGAKQLVLDGRDSMPTISCGALDELTARLVCAEDVVWIEDRELAATWLEDFGLGLGLEDFPPEPPPQDVNHRTHWNTQKMRK